MRPALLRGCLPLLGLLALSPARSAVWHVKPDAPGPVHDGASWATAYPTIQAALDAARPDDEVRVAGGVYRENLTFSVPRVDLRGGYAGTETGAAPPEGPASTILGFLPETPVVFFPPESTDCAVRGFTVLREMPGLEAGIRVESTGALIEGVTVRGIGQPGGWGGGVVFLAQSGGTVRGCLIEGNTAREGAGVQMMLAEVTIERCVIRGNASGDSRPVQHAFPLFGRGGGIWANRSTVRLQWNTITGNRAWSGGGAYLLYGNVTVANNIVTDNIAQPPVPARSSEAMASRGGGLEIIGVEGDLRNNIIAGNSALIPTDSPFDSVAMGGGVLLGNGVTNVVNNTFTGNVSHTGKGNGIYGGLFADHQGIVSNNIFAGNRSDRGSASHEPVRAGRNLWWANTPEDPLERAPHTLVGDPRLTEDYRLRPDSYAIDKGVSAHVLEADLDIDGEPRIRGRRVDLGADEAPPVAGLPIVYVSVTGNDWSDGASWATAKRTVHAGLDAVGLDGEVWVAKGTYSGGVNLEGSISLFGGFAGHEASREGRAIRANETTLEGGGPVVDIPLGSQGVTLDGFTIRNGWRQGSGAGIQSHGANATISRNIIEDNVAEEFAYFSYVSGAGISLRGGPASITHNVIRDNRAFVTIYCAPALIPVPLCLPAPGTEASPYDEYPVVTGGGVEARDAVIFIANNLFTRNWVASSTGGALAVRASSGVVANNTFVDNVRSDIVSPYWVDADAVTIQDCGPDLVFANNVVAFNHRGYRQVRSNVTPHRNAFFANVDGHMFGAPDPDTLEGNMPADPVFVNRAAGDYRPGVGSPLIDAGDSRVVAPGETDLDGGPRIRGARVDIGAYESAPSSALTLGHAAWALRVAAGLAPATSSALATLDVVEVPGVDLRDALAIARRVARE